MKEEYDLSRMQRRKNPFAAKLKKPVTIRLGEDVVDYFKSLSIEMGLPYQSLINLYLKDCVITHRKPNFNWNGELQDGASCAAIEDSEN